MEAAACFSFLVLCLLLRNSAESEEFLPSLDDIKPNARNHAQQQQQQQQQAGFGYNDVVNNDRDEPMPGHDLFPILTADVERVPASKQGTAADKEELLEDAASLDVATPRAWSKNDVQGSPKLDQPASHIESLKLQVDINPIQTIKLPNSNPVRPRSSLGRFGELLKRTDSSSSSISRENSKSRSSNPASGQKSRCPECKEVLESIHKDMQGLNNEMDTIARLIGAVLTQRNCSIHELLPEHHWKLDGKCKDDADTDNRVCSVSCASLLQYPETQKSPLGRAMAPLKLESAPHHGVCATQVDGLAGSFVDLGDWAGSCVSQPERCSSGLSVMAWIKLDISRESNIAYILTSGDVDPRSRGFVVLARYQEELGRNNVGITIWVRDATYFWSAVATAPARRWCHLAFSWSRSGDLDIFVDGQRATRNAVVAQDHSLPSPMTRLTIGNPPSVDKFVGTFAIADLRLHLVRLEERDVLGIYRRDSAV